MDWLDTLDNGRIAADIREFCRDNNRELPTNAAEAFAMYCDWNGLVNYGDSLRRVLYDLVTSSRIATMGQQEATVLREQLEIDR